MKQERIKFGFQARYFQLGEASRATNHLIFVLHGYGQQAKYFIRKFSSLQSNDTCIIAPEGLSRFYLEGFSGRVGATWMTKEDRLADIENYTNYLNTIHQQITATCPGAEVSIIGFSQGAATASRWAASASMDFNKLVLWAGIFPPDMNFDEASDKFRKKNIYYVFGDQDTFLTKERIQEMDVLSKKLGVDPKVLTFHGGHDINAEALNTIFS